MKQWEETLIENPVVAAIRKDNDLQRVIESEVKVVFILYGNIINISSICKKLKDNNKIVFIHVDFIEGLRGDHAGIDFIKEHVQPSGIITTKLSNVKYAKKIGLLTILRIFLIDSLSLQTGIKNLKEILPSAVEIMPGIANKIIKNIKKEVKIPVIAGGLIESKKDVIDALSGGAIAVSTSKYDLLSL
ncbi:glycerol-3-phosphate responsive antiterminator [Clostridium aestuarii]|uniref:Glycerol-3-phosphate responsive antiterminator n=1 Tax=Clostridium aestuarii TaxID=338193 RepID=A0ABT4CWR7_9CLOT|nr:glycerol-3-phosphate responsive antiterminator [Clostridium aestuarii]MCY6483267.1 glycerol-3-phosphate responsive antiterminator [Clostridium aestuarii]